MPDVPDPPWWRRRPEAAPRQKRPLTRDAIVDAALVLLERDGIQGLSMRRLAQELGAGAASLYWHVGDKEELLSLLLDRIVGEAELPEPDPEHWQDAVKELGRAARRLMKSRRDAAQLSMGRIPAGPNSLPVLERNLAVLAASGLPSRVIAHAVDMFSLYVGAFAYEESLRVPALGAEGAEPQLADYFRSLPPEDFPLLTRMADDLTAGGADERFEFALELLVRGLEAMGSAERGGHDGG
jgi:AcrR family transcriptional regulator